MSHKGFHLRYGAILFILCFTFLCRAQQKSAEEDLATRVAAAKTEAERATLLNTSKEAMTPSLIYALVAESDKQRNKGNFADAIAIYTLALGIAEKIGDRALMGLSLDRIGNTNFRRDSYDEALKFLKRSFEIREQLGDKKGVAETLYNTGQVYERQEKYEPAMELYRRAIALSEEVNDRALQGAILRNIGVIFRVQGKYDLASENYRKSLLINEELQDKEGIAAALNSLGGLAYYLRDYTQALDYFSRSLALYEELGYRPRANAVRGNLSTTYVELGQLDLALELAQKYLSEAGEAKMTASRANNLLGNLYFYQSNTALALEYYQKSLALKEELGLNDDIGISLNNIAGVHARQGNYQLALDYYRRALEKRGATKEGVAETLNRIGEVYALLGDPKQAFEYLQKSIAIAEEIKDRHRIASLLNGMGDTLREQAELQKALDYYRRADALFEEIKVRRNRALVNKNIADVYYRMGDYARALDYAGRALRITEELNQPAERPAALTIMGRAYRATGELRLAEKAFNDAIKSVEELRRLAVGGERDRQRFFEGYVSPYYAMVELLVGQNRFYEALDMAERAKGRVLLDALQGGRMNINKSMSAAEQTQERKLNSELISLNAQIARERQQGTPDARRIEFLEQRLQKARMDLEAFETALYASHPELKLSRGEARIIEPTQTVELIPDAKTALLEYVVTEERTYLFVLTRSVRPGQTVADLKAYPIAIGRAELVPLVEDFRRALSERDPAYTGPARRFYDLLLAPARAQLQGRGNLVIVPDASLWDFPFQALVSKQKRFLIEEAAISYAPSFSVLYEMQKLRPRDAAATMNSTLLAFGNPTFAKVTVERASATRRSGEALAPLPETEAEVRQLAQIYGAAQSRVYTGAAALEERAKTESGKFSVIHFATHGVLNNSSPMYSYVLLSQGRPNEDGLLEAWEITKLDLRSNLVVLSACETARGRFGAGEGVLGLTWAFFVAGSPSLVVSQWKVDSAATRLLMLDFHRNLKASSADSKLQDRKAQALRAAALKMLQTGDYKHPFYWASFVLVGNRN